MAAPPTVYTIGHSTHELSHFVTLLGMHGVTVVADVRSHPYSRLEHFRHDSLKASLRAMDIGYVFLGKELGARRDERECYEEGQAVYERVAELPAFLDGIARVERGAADHAIALMCAEREPLNCHRSVLVSRRLTQQGLQVKHILADGAVELHSATEQRMIEAVGLDPLFDAELTKAQLKQRAYAEYGRQIAYHAPDEEGA